MTERLKSRYLIGKVLEKGKSVSKNGFTLIYLYEVLPETVPAQIMFSAPKRIFKTAVERNYIKRILRESWRKQKSPLHDFLLNRQKQMALVLICKKKDARFGDAEKALRELLVSVY